MSQTSRSHATRLVRERERVARFLAERAPMYWRTGERVTQKPGRWKFNANTLAHTSGPDAFFDVHAAREAAQSLVLYGRHWLRVARRLESPRRTAIAGPVGDWADQHPGEAWPLMRGHDRGFVRLGRAVLRAVDGQPSECQACVSEGWTAAGLLMRQLAAGEPISLMVPHAREWHALRDTRYTAWADVSVFDHLTAVGVRLKHEDCPDCHGTGHNLRGVLLALDVSPQLRRRYFDSLHAAQLIDPGARDGRVDIAQWMRGLQKSWIYPGSNYQTRVVPRGEHRRHVTPHEVHEQLHGRMPRPPITYRLTGDWAPMESMSRRRDYETTTYRVGYMDSCQPRWRRGELMHAEQRRADDMTGLLGLSPENMTVIADENALRVGLRRMEGETDAGLLNRVGTFVGGLAVSVEVDDLT